MLFSAAALAAWSPAWIDRASPTAGSAPLSVAFTDLSAGSPTSWLWEFGDGSTSTQQHPTHVYSTPGSYDVTLTASNVAGSGTFIRFGYVQAQVPPPICSNRPRPSLSNRWLGCPIQMPVPS